MRAVFTHYHRTLEIEGKNDYLIEVVFLQSKLGIGKKLWLTLSHATLDEMA